MANKAYKFRIYPNSRQRVLFARTFGCVRFIYNKMLSDKIKYYEETKQKLDNTPAQYKKEFGWLKEVDSLALANAQMNLQKAYNNFFRNPKFCPSMKTKYKNRACIAFWGLIFLCTGCTRTVMAMDLHIQDTTEVPGKN